MAQHQVQVAQVRQGAGDVLHGCIAGGQESRAHQQVLRRVTAQSQLGRDDQAGPLGVGLLAAFDDLAGIAGQVTHRGVELQQGHGQGHGGGHWRGND